MRRGKQEASKRLTSTLQLAARKRRLFPSSQLVRPQLQTFCTRKLGAYTSAGSQRWCCIEANSTSRGRRTEGLGQANDGMMMVGQHGPRLCAQTTKLNTPLTYKHVDRQDNKLLPRLHEICCRNQMARRIKARPLTPTLHIIIYRERRLASLGSRPAQNIYDATRRKYWPRPPGLQPLRSTLLQGANSARGR
jgi:hypothetical protein